MLQPEKTRIIGFGYKARQGKDTCVAMIIAGYPELDIRRYAFADALKLEVTERIGWSGNIQEFFRDWDRGAFPDMPLRPKELAPDPSPALDDPLCPYGKHRDLLAWWGTEYRRTVDPDYWVKRLEERIEIESPQVALISDVRFPNEFEWVVRSGGETVKVSRAGHRIPSTHLSETSLDGWVFNYNIAVLDGDLPGLELAACGVMDQCIAAWSKGKGIPGFTG